MSESVSVPAELVEALDEATRRWELTESGKRTYRMAEAARALVDAVETERTPAEAAFDVDLPCPTCGHKSLLGYLFFDQHGNHQHTHYVCTFWASPENRSDYLDPGYEAEGDRCGWHGWKVPVAARALVDAVPTAKGDGVTDDTAAVQAGAPVVGGWVERPSEDEPCNYGAHFAGCEHEVAAPAAPPSEPPLIPCAKCGRNLYGLLAHDCETTAPVTMEVLRAPSISDEAEAVVLTEEEREQLTVATALLGWATADEAGAELVEAVESIVAARLDRATEENDRE